MQRLRNPRDMVAGLFFSACGLFAIANATDLPFGTTARMGAGYFPTVLGYLLTILGIIISLKGAFIRPKDAGETVYRFDVRIVSVVVAAVAAFAAVLPYLGLYLSLPIMVALSALANVRPNWKETLGIIIFINLFVWIVFIVLIDLHVPMWPSMTGAL